MPPHLAAEHLHSVECVFKDYKSPDIEWLAMTFANVMRLFEEIRFASSKMRRGFKTSSFFKEF